MFALVLAWALSHSAFADHRARFETEFNPDQYPDMAGEIMIQGEQVRLNTDKPASLSVLMNKTTKKAVVLIHMMRMMADADAKKYEKQIPTCVGSAITACLTKTGFKKIRDEKSESGEVSNVYEKSNKDGKVNIWVVKASKEPFPSKMVIASGDGLVVTTLFTESKEVKLDPALFTAPKGYSKSKGFDSIIKAGESMLAPKKSTE